MNVQHLSHPSPSSLLFVPGDKVRRYMPSAQASGAHGLIIDLEDSVSEGNKATARERILSLNREDWRQQDLYLRINPTKSREYELDLPLLESLKPDVLMLSKVESEDEIRQIERLVTSYETNTGLYLPYFIAIESLKGHYNCSEILQSATRAAYLAVGYEDICAELDIDRLPTYVPSPLNTIICQSIIAAKRHDIQILDAVTRCYRPEQREKFSKELSYGKSIGCWGKVLIHPNQVSDTNKVYSLKEKVRWADSTARMFQTAKSGVIVNSEGEMEDMPSYRRAVEILEKLGGITT